MDIGMILQLLDSLFDAGTSGSFHDVRVVQYARHRGRRYLRPPGHLFEVHGRRSYSIVKEMWARLSALTVSYNTCQYTEYIFSKLLFIGWSVTSVCSIS